MVTSRKVIVVGAGNAAGYVAKTIVDKGVLRGEVMIIGREGYAPYERPALSKAFLFGNPPARLPGFHTCVGGGGSRQPPEWYTENGIELLLNHNVTAIDVAAKKVTTASGEEYVAEHLVLATGAAPIVLGTTPGHDSKGIFYLREYDDGLNLYEALKDRTGQTCIVIGGGYIGLETAAAATTMGLKVKMVFPEGNIMPRLFTPEIAKKYEDFYAAKGIEILKEGRLCSEFLADESGNVRGILCKRNEEVEEISGDMVIVGVGARANTSLVRDQLDMDMGGVKVNGKLETSAPGVYAIGDIATFPLKMYDGRMTRMEHVANARAMAEHVVQVIAGITTEDYDYLPYFYSRVFNLSWQFFGDSIGNCTVVGDFSPKILAIWVDSGKVMGVFMESPTSDDTSSLKKIALARPSVDESELASKSSADEALSLLVAAL
uniref:monodehydroascorbate reductase (NADH) n=1 Tax=Compsopogon caeruleus TaxID=31354 RepID=A0A7S1XE02_9RHOD|mmetsp:Transcript_2029/g.3604  ORF Transcript_2029/g.3604 Transcript_2029/m.3604 type:complete len:433 (+) Transcript_2029:133-1431(+)|eukprot:CAMPEP_0184684886 /NCGR_PEP_ID=MMETSP0312-20130426/17010_1 /TAXON_ID=31354 /ORGANISM="Compsopogon coeruleus, Strain SAG 36.94" /LENGTH=432 /DNA_ID=CAMNT_0027138499 /DNA_START=82 /DNA_END=1380 /DNA_ORIENTATION=-